MPNKSLQDLRQDKIIQANKYEAARKANDVLGMRRARKEIERINNQIIRIVKGFE
jgi:hypothetical protein